MSWPRWNGREPVEVHEHHDGAGRRAGYTVVRRSPEWDDEARCWALALTAAEADQCPGCQAPMSETTDPAAEGRYRTELPVRCHRCTAVAVGAEPYGESPQPHALLFPVTYTPPPPAGPERTDGR